jgi:hypothetical protein
MPRAGGPPTAAASFPHTLDLTRTLPAADVAAALAVPRYARAHMHVSRLYAVRACNVGASELLVAEGPDGPVGDNKGGAYTRMMDALRTRAAAAHRCGQPPAGPMLVLTLQRGVPVRTTSPRPSCAWSCRASARRSGVTTQ